MIQVKIKEYQILYQWTFLLFYNTNEFKFKYTASQVAQFSSHHAKTYRIKADNTQKYPKQIG